jgi:acetyltransferase-like isoleucine patch superfamily enzyme
MPKLRTCVGSIAGALSLLIKNVNPNSTLFGIPAKVLKF